MKIPITGSKGQLGSDCMSVFRKENEIIGVDIDKLDITDYASVEAIMWGAIPDVIINCAAYTDMDGSESEKEMAWQVNAKEYQLYLPHKELLRQKLVE